MPSFQFEYDIKKFAELNVEEQQLIKSALKAVDNAYAPYSNFFVGAAILLSNNEIICGSNMENAAFSTTICAERTAISEKHNRYPKEQIKLLAIAHKNISNPQIHKLLSPCGECRQAIAEQSFLQENPIPIYIYKSDDEIYIIPDSDYLLPFGFGGDNLK